MSTDAGRVYLDHNATSPLRPEALDATLQAFREVGGNPDSMHEEGRAARAMLERARERVARMAGANAGDVVFTSGGSEAIAAAVRGVCDRAPADRRRIVVSAVEHPAVLRAVELAARRGFVVVVVPCDPDGRADLERFVLHLGDDVALAALQWANHETGVIQPVEEAGRACREAGVPFLVDAVQAAGKIRLDPGKVFADLMALSAHKVGGPQGAGALVVRRGIVLAPMIGGVQERRRRGGTPAVATIAGFGAAAEATVAGMPRETRRSLRLRARIEARLRDAFDDVRIQAQTAPRLVNTVNFIVPGVPGDALVIALDLAGFAASTGSACSSGAAEPSPVLRAMGLSEEEARGAVRLSVGWNTLPDQIDRFLERLPGVVEQVREGLEPAG